VSQERSDSGYLAGKRDMQQHMNEIHATAGQEVRVPEEQIASVQSLSRNYQQAIHEQHASQRGRYSSHDYTRGAIAAVREWEETKTREFSRENGLFRDGSQNRRSESLPRTTNELSQGLQQGFERAGRRTHSRER
jgi:hypothetical protein